MGFSAIPPRADFDVLLRSMDLWMQRADAAIIHINPQWDSLLVGVPADVLVRRDPLPLAEYFRAHGLVLVVTLDATDGLNRAAEAPGLVAAGRSLAEPEVRELYRHYAVAIDTLLRPDYLGLAAETNLIRAANMRESTTLYRHDLALAAVPDLPRNPHSIFYSGSTPDGEVIASAAKREMAEFLASGGARIPDVNYLVRPRFGVDLFGVPQILPEGLSFPK